MKRLITALAAIAALAAFAEYSQMILQTGRTGISRYSGKVSDVRIMSGVAGGTATLKSVYESDVIYDTTNSVHVVMTNVLSSAVTCTNGCGRAYPSSTPNVIAGDRLFIEGTADGFAIIQIER